MSVVNLSIVSCTISVDFNQDNTGYMSKHVIVSILQEEVITNSVPLIEAIKLCMK